MSQKAKFTQTDIARAVKGALSAGLIPTRIEIETDGRIVLVFGVDQIGENAYDQWKRDDG